MREGKVDKAQVPTKYPIYFSGGPDCLLYNPCSLFNPNRLARCRRCGPAIRPVSDALKTQLGVLIDNGINIAVQLHVIHLNNSVLGESAGDILDMQKKIWLES